MPPVTPSSTATATALPLESEAIFSSLNAVLLGWLLLALAPRWRYTAGVTLALGAGYSLLYAALALEAALEGDQPEGAGFGSLAAVQALFSKPRNVLAGWTHYIAYDLLIARGAVLDSHTRGVPWMLMTACLPLMLMVGPLGLVAYLGVASFYPSPQSKSQAKAD